MQLQGRFAVVLSHAVVPREETTERRRLLFEEAARVIEANLGYGGLDLAVVAEEVGTSTRQLQRAFDEVAGEGFRDYLDRFRMECASALLRDPDLTKNGLSVSQVSRVVGYSQPANFAKAFRRHFGVAPQAVRPEVPPHPSYLPPGALPREPGR